MALELAHLRHFLAHCSGRRIPGPNMHSIGNAVDPEDPNLAALDLRRIVAYRYAIESVCLSWDTEGGVEETLKPRGVHEMPVGRGSKP